MKIYLKIIFCNIFLIVILNQILIVKSHARLLEPVGRASRWRFNSSAPIDWNDNEGFCGGRYKQWEIHNGKCGLCGDDYGNSIPRSHELGGVYGEGIIVQNYKSGSQINVGVYITANHKGYFIFDLCNINSNNYLESEECFKNTPLKLLNGDYKYYIGPLQGWSNTTIEIPNELTCKHCVFRWTYVCGNSWGICSNGTGALGCGPQETFKGCSDISIQN